MRTQLFKAPRADKHNRRCQRPKIRRQMRMLPKPLVVDETLPITFDQIISRIELEDELKLLRYHLQIPENRRAPKAELQNHADELSDVA